MKKKQKTNVKKKKEKEAGEKSRRASQLVSRTFLNFSAGYESPLEFGLQLFLSLSLSVPQHSTSIFKYIFFVFFLQTDVSHRRSDKFTMSHRIQEQLESPSSFHLCVCDIIPPSGVCVILFSPSPPGVSSLSLSLFHTHIQNKLTMRCNRILFSLPFWRVASRLKRVPPPPQISRSQSDVLLSLSLSVQTGVHR